MPLGVVIPDGDEDVEVAVQLASEYGVPVLPRGGGTSQNGQTVGEALVLDTTRHLNQLLTFDSKGRTAMCPARHGAGSSQSFPQALWIVLSG